MNEDTTQEGSRPVAGPLQRPVGRLVPERASTCGLTECAGKPMCERCYAWQQMDTGWPASARTATTTCRTGRRSSART